MPTPILMPALSPTMTEGNIVKWTKKEGDRIKPGEVIAEIETDKATMEVESADAGILGKIIVPAGSNAVKVNQTIAILIAEGEKVGDVNLTPSSNLAQPVLNDIKTLKQPNNDSQRSLPEKQQPISLDAQTPGMNKTIHASPLARKMAELSGIQLDKVNGTGPNGRIIKHDIEQFLEGGVSDKMMPHSTNSNAKSGVVQNITKELFPAFKEIAISNMRRTIAKRLVESKRDAPHFYLTIDCELDNLLKLRQDINSRLDKEKLSINDFIIKATAIALKQTPQANVSWAETYLRQYDSVDISVAVAIPGGLITPIIRQADQKSLLIISKEMKDLAQRAKDGKLKPEEYQGGTFSISNLGMYGIKNFSAILNPPQAAILAIGAGEAKPVVKDGAISIAQVMNCTLSVDHRAIDGVAGAEFLAALKKIIQDPLSILL